MWADPYSNIILGAIRSPCGCSVMDVRQVVDWPSYSCRCYNRSGPTHAWTSIIVQSRGMVAGPNGGRGMNAPLSYICMTWDRSAWRLRNMLHSLLLHQEVIPEEVIVVDTSRHPKVVRDIAELVASLPRARLIQIPSDSVYKSWALNVGIRASFSKYVACTDMDYIFSPNFTKRVMKYFRKGNEFIMASAQWLPEKADLRRPFRDYEKLKALSAPWPGPAEGTLQAAARAWWFKVHGYDEKFGRGLGGMDSDMWMRAQKDDLQIKQIRHAKAQALHQWHPRSSMKEAGTHLMEWNLKKLTVVRNLKGWGER